MSPDGQVGDVEGSAQQDMGNVSFLRWEEIAVQRFRAGTKVVELSIQYDDIVNRRFSTEGYGAVWETLAFKPPAGSGAPHGDTQLGLGGAGKHEIMHLARLRAAELAKENGYVLVEDGAFAQVFELNVRHQCPSCYGRGLFLEGYDCRTCDNEGWVTKDGEPFRENVLIRPNMDAEYPSNVTVTEGWL